MKKRLILASGIIFLLVFAVVNAETCPPSLKDLEKDKVCTGGKDPFGKDIYFKKLQEKGKAGGNWFTDPAVGDDSKYTGYVKVTAGNENKYYKVESGSPKGSALDAIPTGGAAAVGSVEPLPTPPGGIETTSFTIDGKTVTIPASDVAQYFDEATITLKQGAYDPATGVWTKKDNTGGSIPYRYFQDGQVKVGGEYTPDSGNTDVWELERLLEIKSVKSFNGKLFLEYPDGGGLSVGTSSPDGSFTETASLASSQVQFAGGIANIELDSIVETLMQDNSFVGSLRTNDGSIIRWQTMSNHFDLVSKTTPSAEANKPATTTTTLTLSNGKKLEGTEAVENIVELKDKTLKLNDKDYTVSAADAGSITLVGKKGTSAEGETWSVVANKETVTTTEKKGDKTKTTEQKLDSSGDISSQTVTLEEDGEVQEETVINYETDNNGNVVEDSTGKPVIKETGIADVNFDGSIDSIEYRNPKNELIGYSVYADGTEVRFLYDDKGEVTGYQYTKPDGDKAGGDLGDCAQDGTCKKIPETTIETIKNKKATELFWNKPGWAVAEEILGSAKSLRGFYDLIGGPDWLRPMNWLDLSDQAFASVLSEKWFVAPFCNSRYDIDSKGTAYIETSSGTFQAVAHAEAERSPETVFIFCDEERPCPEEYACGKDGICYDGKTPAQAYFYRVSWAVTAPFDEEFTTEIDEQGNAVSFNVKMGEDNWLYEIDGVSSSKTIKLKPGENDRDMMVRYSFNPNIDEICIYFSSPPLTLGGFGEGVEEIENPVCNDVTTAALKEFSGSESSSSSASVSSGKVTPVGGFLK